MCQCFCVRSVLDGQFRVRMHIWDPCRNNEFQSMPEQWRAYNKLRSLKFDVLVVSLRWLLGIFLRDPMGPIGWWGPMGLLGPYGPIGPCGPMGAIMMGPTGHMGPMGPQPAAGQAVGGRRAEAARTAAGGPD